MLRNYIGRCAIFLLSYEFKLILCFCENSTTKNLQDLPLNWPCEWNNGTIPYTLNFFLYSPRRLISIVYRGIKYIQDRSCLTFNEEKPTKVATVGIPTYLYFTYSDVLENCCLSFSSSYLQRRIVLITPLCTSPAETAHAILHAMGLNHRKKEPFTSHKITLQSCMRA
ncbi:uncharacterized protein LOC116768150 isoform X2 [Danaus plexippus]|uniref:uncharacterized protein LOC116768150 isoform X2 n=1 Tax=Danaus plexippus TaxID=13037 RepID=UPI002AB100DE|nr:uncharacterized protein LOC116768150 isoform X2 [Danaus plexippus]